MYLSHERCDERDVIGVDVINPNAQHKSTGKVTKLSRSHNGSLNLEVTLSDGRILNELGFIYHKSLRLGDEVNVTIGFSIMSDRYGIRSVRRVRGFQAKADAQFKANLDSITYADILEFRANKEAK